MKNTLFDDMSRKLQSRDKEKQAEHNKKSSQDITAANSCRRGFKKWKRCKMGRRAWIKLIVVATVLYSGLMSIMQQLIVESSSGISYFFWSLAGVYGTPILIPIIYACVLAAFCCSKTAKCVLDKIWKKKEKEEDPTETKSNEGEVNKKPETPGNQKVPGKPEVPNKQEASGILEVPKKPETPRKSEVPKKQETPKKTEVSNKSDVPRKPEAPGKSDVPQKQETPKKPEVPNKHEASGILSVPKKPETPRKSDVPEKQETPKKPEVSNKTEVPGTTEVPKKPEVRAKAQAPGEPEVLVKPESCGKSEVPKKAESALWADMQNVLAQFVDYMHDIEDNLDAYATNCEAAGWTRRGYRHKGITYRGHTVADVMKCRLMVGALHFVTGWQSPQPPDTHESQNDKDMKAIMRCMVANVFAYILAGIKCGGEWLGPDWAWETMKQFAQAIHQSSNPISDGTCTKDIYKGIKIGKGNLKAAVRKWFKQSKRVRDSITQIEKHPKCKMNWEMYKKSFEATGEAADLSSIFKKETMQTLVKEHIKEVLTTISKKVHQKVEKARKRVQVSADSPDSAVESEDDEENDDDDDEDEDDDEEEKDEEADDHDQDHEEQDANEKSKEKKEHTDGGTSQGKTADAVDVKTSEKDKKSDQRSPGLAGTEGGRAGSTKAGDTNSPAGGSNDEGNGGTQPQVPASPVLPAPPPPGAPPSPPRRPSITPPEEPGPAGGSAGTGSTGVEVIDEDATSGPGTGTTQITTGTGQQHAPPAPAPAPGAVPPGAGEPQGPASPGPAPAAGKSEEVAEPPADAPAAVAPKAEAAPTAEAAPPPNPNQSGSSGSFSDADLADGVSGGEGKGGAGQGGAGGGGSSGEGGGGSSGGGGSRSAGGGGPRGSPPSSGQTPETKDQPLPTLPPSKPFDPKDLVPYVPAIIPAVVAIGLIAFFLWKYFAYLAKRRRTYRTVRDIPSPPLDEEILQHLQRGDLPPPDSGYTLVRHRPPASTSARRPRPTRVHKRTIIELHLEVLHECEATEWENVKEHYWQIVVEEFAQDVAHDLQPDAHGHSSSPASSSNHDSPGIHVSSTVDPSTDTAVTDASPPNEDNPWSCMETIQLATDPCPPNDPDPWSCMENIQLETDASPPNAEDPDPWNCMETTQLHTDPCRPTEEDPDPCGCMETIQLHTDASPPNEHDPWRCMETIHPEKQQRHVHSHPGDAPSYCTYWINWIHRNKHLLQACTTQPWFLQLKADWKQYLREHMVADAASSEHKTAATMESKKLEAWKEWVAKQHNHIETYSEEEWFRHLLENIEEDTVTAAEKVPENCAIHAVETHLDVEKAMGTEHLLHVPDIPESQPLHQPPHMNKPLSATTWILILALVIEHCELESRLQEKELYVDDLLQKL
ncbi:hypothetical protein AK88_04718 [Plasmodium fragile]|uniref:Schizont-infected cell agglutination C-terminal domain-containing protein n=1 Tax=Plasmodium fragile TaxID=5857 RepID=A0A0D9QIW4_PLAFR|nr:uncharacterized protein AK88_04718 [Plasmodium fragile]KJP85646.1 hypothetical protein AK88_04718 [Plasmodium fragile]